MKTTIKVFGIINIVLGAIAILASMTYAVDFTTFIGGMWWVANGIVVLVYIQDKK